MDRDIEQVVDRANRLAYRDQCAEIKARWYHHDLDGLPGSIAGCLGYQGIHANSEHQALLLADRIIRAILEDWVILRRPATVGELHAAPAEVRAAAEVQRAD